MIVAGLDWQFVLDNLPELLGGLRRTLEVAAIGIAGASVVGVVLGAARAHRIPVVSQLAAVYVEFIRNTPILVQLFFLYYGLPPLGRGLNDAGIPVGARLELEAFTIAWLALMIWGGAFNTENFRAGFEAVPQRYREAGLALGLSRMKTFLNVTLPIGGRIALPSSINTYISVLKNTSLLTAVAFPELTHVARNIAALTFNDTEIILVLALTYLVLVWTLSALIRVVEGRLALPKEAA